MQGSVPMHHPPRRSGDPGQLGLDGGRAFRAARLAPDDEGEGLEALPQRGLADLLLAGEIPFLAGDDQVAHGLVDLASLGPDQAEIGGLERLGPLARPDDRVVAHHRPDRGLDRGRLPAVRAADEADGDRLVHDGLRGGQLLDLGQKPLVTAEPGQNLPDHPSPPC